MDWLLSDPVEKVVALLSGIVTIITFALTIFGFYKKNRRSKNNRVSEAVANYRLIYKGDGCRLKCLIPSGIHELKNDSEIERYFNELMRIEPSHPLRQWDDEIKKIGYKKFFESVFQNGQGLSKNNISFYINKFS